MELIITEKNATICLNMIVKNESHIIKNTLEKLCNKITFDYWVICDTGSTDNTPQIITDFFREKNIKGELFHDEWINFAHNRTLALERAYKKTQLLLIFDADDELVGNFKIPTEVLYDQYYLKFGSQSGTSYTRSLLINNYKRFEFLSVIHEFISCKEEPSTSCLIDGDYYVVSGRSGSRNLDPNKYLKDALILEKAHKEAVEKNDPLLNRYAYYCANSYKDCGRFEDAIKWYKITLNQENQWNQEQYTACLYIYNCYKALAQEETGFFYLVQSFKYDNERLECLYPLLVHYCCQDMHNVAYSYYCIVKNYFENRYLQSNLANKLFVHTDIYNFFVPYYMVLIADKIKDFECVIRMYEIVFIKKQKMFQEWFIKNFLYNLQFFIQHIPSDKFNYFIRLANEYISFLYENKVNIQNFDFLSKDVYITAGINYENYIITELTNKPQKFSQDHCKTCKNILIYTGYSDIKWNYTYTLNNALGGSEKAVAYISKCFPQDYSIYISGDVKNETLDNIQYIHFNELTNLINNTPFHTVIVSRYIDFYEMFKECSFYQSYIWAHDTILLPYGFVLNDAQTQRILLKWNKYINGCICLTEWHKNLFIERYPILTNKIQLINNGLDINSFKQINTTNKIKNKFIYSSRPERGLHILLELWPKILEKIPDATLSIATYGDFPSNPQEILLKHIIDNNESIHFLGKLNTQQLYNEMSSSEYWLYPTNWPETSCITALEMLMTEVICIYYPVAGLPNTIDNYGIQVIPGTEIDTIVSLTDEQKYTIRKNGREYAEKCSWKNRSLVWSKLLLLNVSTDNIIHNNTNKIAIFNSFPFHYEMFGYLINYCKENNFELNIFTNFENNLGWIDFYKNHFNTYKFDYKGTNEYESLKDTFDITFITTDDDYTFKTEWINDKCIAIEHTNINRRPEYKFKIGTRPFINSHIDWVIPFFNIFEEKDKLNNLDSDINIAVIGGNRDYNYDTINRLDSNKQINLFVLGRHALLFNIGIVKQNINVTLFNNIQTDRLFEILNKCDYILTDSTTNSDHIDGISMSGNIPLSFSTLTPLIISKGNNSIYKFKNVIEFDIDSSDKIFVDKSLVDIKLLSEERIELSSMLTEWLQKNKLLNYNIFYFEHDDVHVRLLQNKQNKTIYQNFSNRSNAEIMFRKLVSYIMPNFIDKNIIDLGAYIGDNTIPWALKMRGIIYAIDPSNENISFIKKMASINNLNNIVTIEKAVSDKNETIYCNETDTTHISCNTSNGIHSFDAVSLDSLNLENIGFIHLDVEGFEKKILYGAINIITKYNPIIVWENHIERENYMQVVNFLSEHKYTTYMINEQFPHCFPDCRNFISFPENCNISVNELNHKFKEIYTEFTPDKNNPFLISIKTNITYAITNKIPKKIFQTWETTDIEQEFQQIINKWKENNPNYEYIFHDAEQRLQFIQDNFKENVLNAYKKIIPGAYKCDLWRYCVLYIYGGFYADIDTLCMGKLDSLTNEHIEFIVPIDLNINPIEGQHNLACGFIGSVPKSPILLDAIDRIVFNVENNIIPTSKLDFSGPGLLGRAVNKFLNLDETNSFKGKEGIQNNINFLEFEPNTEYIKDVSTDIIILQNKNKNPDIIRIYNNECNKIQNYTCWLSNNAMNMA